MRIMVIFKVILEEQTNQVHKEKDPLEELEAEVRSLKKEIRSI